jgi:hypothetical protein
MSAAINVTEGKHDRESCTPHHPRVHDAVDARDVKNTTVAIPPYVV